MIHVEEGSGLSPASGARACGVTMGAKNGFVGFVCSLLCLTVMLLGCSTGGPLRSDGDPPQAGRFSERAEQSRKVLAERNPTIMSRIGHLQLTTRMATPGETVEDPSKAGLLFSAEGAGALALGLFAPPMFASTLVVGGVLLIPLGTYAYYREKAIGDSINGALMNAEFTRAIDGAVKARLEEVFPEEGGPAVKAEIIVQTLGLLAPSRHRGCIVASADFRLSAGEMELKQETLQITLADRTEDAPPPQCASLERLAENEARLVKDTLTEYAEVLAEMAAGRIRKGTGR